MSWLDGPLDDSAFMASDEEVYDNSHTECLVCLVRGHLPDAECPNPNCEDEELVEHCHEFMHRKCVEVFEKEIEGQV